MNSWPFVIAAYAVAILGAAWLLVWSWRKMRSAEAAADALSPK